MIIRLLYRLETRKLVSRIETISDADIGSVLALTTTAIATTIEAASSLLDQSEMRDKEMVNNHHAL